MRELPADPELQTLLYPYPAVVRLPVQWGDMDAMQHVNNVVYFRWFESSRIHYFESLGLMDLLEEAGIGPILHSIRCRYRIPLTYPDTVWVGTRITEIEADRVHMRHLVVSQAHGRIAAEGAGTVVTYDYRAARKAPVPELVRRRILELEREAVTLSV